MPRSGEKDGWIEKRMLQQKVGGDVKRARPSKRELSGNVPKKEKDPTLKANL